MIWALFALILLPVAFLIIKGGRQDDKEADPVTHYRRQLAELDEDVEKRVLSKDEAAGARLEIERRILAIADTRDRQSKGIAGNVVMSMALVGIIALTSFALYAQLGSPAAKSVASQVDNMLETQLTPDGMTYGEAIAKITTHLEQNPGDVEGWQMLARSTRSVGAHSDTANAFARLVELEPNNVDWRVQQLEAFLAMAAGQVTPAAGMLVQTILEADPQNPAGLYYLGMLRMQKGDQEAAKAIWTSLADLSPADAPWMPTVRAQLSRLGVAPPQLSQEQMDSVAAMNEAERDAFVRSMIERLEARLESSPADAQGWLMLARSKAAIGEKDAAIADLTRAIDLVAPAERPQLQAFLDNLRQSPNP